MTPRRAALAGLFLLPLAVYLAAIRPTQLRWGATPAECAMPLPGDRLIAHPSLWATRAVTIAAPPERIWPWIVQIGYNRAGFYGYDLIENIGSTRGLSSATRILPDLQRLAPGDRVYMSGLAYFLIHQIEANRTLVWASDESPAQGAFTFHLIPLDPNHTRLLVRARIQYHWTGPLLPLDLFTEFGDHVAVPRMLLGIRDLAEGRPLPPLWLQAVEIAIWLLALAEFFLAARRIFLLPDWRRPWLAGLLAAGILLLAWYARPPLWIPALLLLAPIPLLRRTPLTPGPPITADDIAALPEPARRYARFLRLEGRPRDVSFRLRFTGRFRTRPDQPWLPCRTRQYDHRPTVTRIFHIRIRMAGIVPVIARDTYLNGRGRMLVRLFGLIPVVNGTGPEYDLGELVTYLNDAVLLAPTFLFTPAITWTPVDDASFDLTLTDHGLTVTARVFVAPDGAPTDFSTTDRYCALPSGLVRARWTTPIPSWQWVDGRPLPVTGEAIWHLPAGPFAYADFQPVPESLQFNL